MKLNGKKYFFLILEKKNFCYIKFNMELLNNFSEIFLSVWNKGILGVDIFQILIGIGIFLIFLIFRGLLVNLL